MKAFIILFLFSKILYLNVLAVPKIKSTYCKCCYNNEIDPQSILDDYKNNNNNKDNENNKKDNEDNEENNEDNNKDNIDSDNTNSDTANSDEISNMSDFEEIEDLYSEKIFPNEETVANNNNNNNNNGNIDNKDDKIVKELIEKMNNTISLSYDIIQNIDKFKKLEELSKYEIKGQFYFHNKINSFYLCISEIADKIKQIYKINDKDIEQLINLIKIFKNLENNSLGFPNQNIDNLNNILLEIKNNNNFRNNLKIECDNLLEIIKNYENDKLNKFKILYTYFTGYNYESEIKNINDFINILNEKNNSFKKNIGDILNKYENIKTNNIILINKLDIKKDEINKLKEYKDKNTDIDENTLNNPDNFKYYENIYNYYKKLKNNINLKPIILKKILFNYNINDDVQINILKKSVINESNDKYLFAVENIINKNKKNIKYDNLFIYIYSKFYNQKKCYYNKLIKYDNNSYYSANINKDGKISRDENIKNPFINIKNTNIDPLNYFNVYFYNINLIDKVGSYFENKDNLENKDKSLNIHKKSKSENIFKKKQKITLKNINKKY